MFSAPLCHSNLTLKGGQVGVESQKRQGGIPDTGLGGTLRPQPVHAPLYDGCWNHLGLGCPQCLVGPVPGGLSPVLM